ncbi:MAG TPA: beta-phosphoglucomutase family hydrolase [Candidatus Didemnitutus sp.]|jgi:beta-phosphoglucomutase family hydrolase
MPSPCVIFDWDGVIVDSSKAHEEAWEQLGIETGRSMPEGHFKAGFGRKNEQIIPHILKWDLPEADVVRLGRRKEELYREVLRRTGIAPLPGVTGFLDRLKAAGVSSAVGSSTERRNIETILAIIGLGSFFRAIVTAEDVSRGKPDPEVFLTAAGRIEADPSRCVVFEDAFAGLEAARAAGMKAIAVATTHPPEALEGRADRIVRRLDEVSVADLQSLVTD